MTDKVKWKKEREKELEEELKQLKEVENEEK